MDAFPDTPQEANSHNRLKVQKTRLFSLTLKKRFVRAFHPDFLTDTLRRFGLRSLGAGRAVACVRDSCRFLTIDVDFNLQLSASSSQRALLDVAMAAPLLLEAD